jgi:NAD(P)H-quinone oxidoreductase subunit 3
MLALDDYYRQYGFILILTVVAVIIPTSMILLSWLLRHLGIRPSRYNHVKHEVYECGMETIGGRWTQFNSRYYLYALLFVIFDVETVFIYPWAVHFNKLGLFAFVEMLMFLLVLVVGWVYAWRKRALEWS